MSQDPTASNDPLVPSDPLAPDTIGVPPDSTVDTRSKGSSELRTRVASAAVLGLAVVVLAYFGGWPFRALCVVVGLVILQEWTAMTGCLRPFGLPQGFSIVAFAIIALAVLVGAYDVALVLTAIGFAIAYAMSFVRLREKPRPPEVRHWSWLSLGILYASLIMVSFAVLRGDSAFGLAASAFLLAVVWATDIFAYFVGKNVGGPKLAPAISPNKTWSGFLGGITFAVLFGLLVAWAYRANGSLPAISFWLVPVAIVLSIVSQCGDLFESWVKRRSGAKDSGRIIPGHGGLMDRIDGLGAAAIAALGLLLLGTGGTDMSDALFAIFG